MKIITFLIIYSVLLFVLFISPVVIAGNVGKVLDKTLDLSYEAINLPDSEKMGLAGGNYLVKAYKYLDFGLGVYGAVRGKRGGFFTGGAQLKSQFSLSPVTFLGVEGFIGGGGGGSAPQGGGLMLRGASFVGAVYGANELKLGYSYITFPNGDISSEQWFLGYAYRFKSLHFPGWSNKALSINVVTGLTDRLAITPKQFSFQTSFYFPTADNKTVSGETLTQRLDVIGVRYQSLISKKLWFDFETGGAMGGGIDGFAQVFSGMNYKQPISKRVTWSSGISLGAAGGGRVSTGGGSMLKMYTGSDVQINKNWILYSHIGLITAPGGEFTAASFNINLGRTYNSLTVGGAIKFSDASSAVNKRKFRIRPGIQSYSSYRRHSRKSSDVVNHPVSSVQIKLDSFFTKTLFFTGHAIGAFDGKAGGYAVGLVGAGFQFLPFANIEFLVGAAGGGGIDVGNGEVIQPMLNAEIPLNKAWSIEPGVGYIHAISGGLSSWVSNFGLSYRFSSPAID